MMDRAAAHDHILATARRLFKERGYDGVTISGVMAAAGFAPRAFYRHFASKADLHAQAMARRGFAEDLRQHMSESAEPLATLIDAYLSPRHRDDRAGGCTVAALCGEAASDTGGARAVLADGLPALVADISRHGGVDTATARALAIQLVGGLILARATEDPRESAALLRAARTAARDLAGLAPDYLEPVEVDEGGF